MPHPIKFALLFLLLPVIASPKSILSSNSIESESTLLRKWATQALKFFDFSRCTKSGLGSEDECYNLAKIRDSKIALYAGRVKEEEFQFRGIHFKGEMKDFNKVFTIFPDSVNGKSSGSHDLVLAIDPTPQSSFGHLVAVFYIDFGITSQCKEPHQLLLPESTCITLAKKERCPNLLERFIGSGQQPKRCHMDFLPTVHQANSDEGAPQTDLLDCIPLPGFATCPKLRSIEETAKILCDPSHTNSRRCDTSYTGVGTRCKLFQTCDRGVLIGGGWNRMNSGFTSLNNIYKMDEMLQRIGFLKENIKLFYANGQSSGAGGSVGGKARKGYFSSAMKTGMRGHLRSICETTYCADTLFIYLNNPTTIIEGDMLLWDVDSNGIADNTEKYTTREFLNDIAGCQAKRIVIVSDQSNSMPLLSQLKDSPDHQNVVLFTPGQENQLTNNGELTAIFTNHSHPASCLKHIHQSILLNVKDSNPIVFDSSFGPLMSLSLNGSPCDLNPPLSKRELALYQACQNVPTSIWFSLNDGLTGIDEEEEEGDDEMYGESSENSPSGRRGM